MQNLLRDTIVVSVFLLNGEVKEKDRIDVCEVFGFE